MNRTLPRVRLVRHATITALTALTVASAAAADYPTTVLSKNPVAYWRFNESATSPPPNIVANSSKLGPVANGYVVLDVGKGEPGIVGNAIRLNDQGSTVGHCGSKVDVPFNPALNPYPPFSVEFWAKPNSLGGDTTGSCPLSSFNPNWFGGGNRSGYLFYLNNAGRWQLRLGTVGGYAAVLSATSGNATVGTWQHIAATWDGVTASIYVNGTLVGTTPAAVANWTPNTQMALRFGGTGLTGDLTDGPAISASGLAGNRGYDGWLDEVAVYQAVLSPSTVAAHYSAASTNNAGYSAQILADNPVGYWNMNEPAAAEPDPSTLPIAANSGSLGSAGDGTNSWGVVAAQTGPAYGGFGAGNNACVFNGESGYLALPDAAGLHFSGNITLMAWVKPGVKDFFRDIIAHGWNESYAETFLRISRNGLLDLNDPLAYGDGTNYYEIGVTDGSTYYDSALFPIPDGDLRNWVFLAGTYDGSKWNLYRNGTLVSSLTSANGALDVTNRWSIGSRSGPSSTPPSSASGPDQAFAAEGLFFGGAIDEPAIFNTALSASDINAIYNSALVPPVITEAPLAPTGTFYSGSAASFSVWAEGSPPLGYLWLSNGISTGVTTTNLSLSNFAAGIANIAVVVTNAYGSATGAVSFMAIGSAPLILASPQPSTRYTGFPFTFSVSGGGSTPLAYQWQTNGVDIPGATSSSYSGIASAATAFNYSCTLSNAFGTSNSAPAALTVLAIPAGYPSAVLTNGPPIAYWRLGETNGSVAYDYVGGHNGNYYKATLGEPGYSVLDPDTAVTFSGVNSYVGDISGTEINFSGHTNFTLEAWVNGPPAMPDESTIIAKGAGSSGTTATEQFSLDVAGGNFRFFTRGGGNSIYEADATTGPDGTWQHVVGVYNDTEGQLSIYVNGELQGTGNTRPAGLRVSDSLVSIGSKHLGNDPAYDGTFNGTIDEVAVYAYPLDANTVFAHYAAAYGSSLKPVIALPPASLTNYVTLPAKFSVSAYGSVPLTYQWKKNGADISGATLSSYTINSLVAGDAGNYSVAVSNALGGLVSAPASLTVLQPPTSTVLLSGLVLHLTFDNSLTDSTGRGNNGTAIHTTVTSSNVTTASFVADGVVGQALHYSSDMGSYPGPTTTNNTYVTLGVRPDLQFSSNIDFTIGYWIRLPLNYIAGDLPFFTTSVGSTFNPGLVFAPSYGSAATAANTGTVGGGWAMSIYDSGLNGVGVYGDIGSINDGSWHHLVHVFQRGVGATTYLDGVAIPSDAVPLHHSSKQAGTSAAAAGNIDTGSPATIGQDPTGTYGETGSADMDDFGVWRRALTPLEVGAIYMGAISNKVSFDVALTPTPTISISKSASSWVITYTGKLYSSGTVSTNTTWTLVGGATSPYTIPSTTKIQFYRAGP